MRSRVTVVILCVGLCVCLSVTTLVARELISDVQAWYQQNQYNTSKGFNSWILLKVLCSKVMASFTSSIGAAIHVYEVRFVFYSYPNAMTWKRRPLTALQVIFWLLFARGPQRKKSRTPCLEINRNQRKSQEIRRNQP